MKDTEGREWSFRFTGLTVRDLAAATGLDTKSLTGPQSLIVKIGECESTLYRVLWITIRPQAEARGLTEDQWFACLDDNAIQSATEEWLEAYVNFSPPARRAVLAKTIQAIRQAREKETEVLMNLVQSGQMDEIVQSNVQKAYLDYGNSAANSQPS